MCVSKWEYLFSDIFLIFWPKPAKDVQLFVHKNFLKSVTNVGNAVFRKVWPMLEMQCSEKCDQCWKCSVPSILQENGENLVCVDDWVKFKASRETVAVIKVRNHVVLL